MTVRGKWVLAAVTSVALLLIVAAVVPRSGTALDRTAPAPGATTASASNAAPPVVVPGRPGESAQVFSAEEVRRPGSPYNSMDTWFVRMMIPHHEQALEMAALVPDRAADPQLKALADRIRASQGPEIGVLRAWLQARSLPAEIAGHDHGTMRGMQSPEAMQRLADARGAEFDRLFVDMMSDHHEGAIEMANNLLKVGADLTLSEFANSIAIEQSVEINRMRELLGS